MRIVSLCCPPFESRRLREHDIEEKRIGQLRLDQTVAQEFQFRTHLGQDVQCLFIRHRRRKFEDS